MTSPPLTSAPLTSPTRSAGRGATYGCLVLGGLLAQVATAQGWWRAAAGGAAVAFLGTEATGGLSQALAVVALAGTLLVLVLRTRGRRVLAVLLGLAGLAIILVGVLRRAPGGAAVRTRLRQVSLADSYALSPTVWPWLFAVAGLLVLAGSTLLWRGAPHWVARPDRFARSPEAPSSVASAADDPAAVWRALDAGVDPTVTDDESEAPAANDPNAADLGLRGQNGIGEAPIRERGA